MNILVLNGSPKGSQGVTAQYVRFLSLMFPQHCFTSVDAARQIRQLEQNNGLFIKTMEQVRQADAVLWAFPVYYLLVSAQYKRFIELIWERGAIDNFHGKYTAVLTTSIRFYDFTAHNYINAIADDLGMRYCGAYSAEMQDLFKEAERQRLTSNFAAFLRTVENRLPTRVTFGPQDWQPVAYTPVLTYPELDAKDKKVLVVTDATPEQDNLNALIAKFIACFDATPEIVNLHDIDIRGGCLGCMKCSYDNTCCYEGKDEFICFYKEKVEKADIIVFAGAMRDRYLSALWKIYFDRSFFKNHTPTLQGKQVAFLISGPLSQNANLRLIFQAYIEMQNANLVGFVTDENCLLTDALLERLAAECIENAQIHYVQSPTFLSTGGHKLIRDAIWGQLHFPFAADHRYFTQHGGFDFPQKQFGAYLLNWAARIPTVRKHLYGERMLYYMTKPYKDILEKMKYD